MQLLQDTFIIEQLQVINEGQAVGPMKIRGIFGRCNEKNNNGRIYPTAVLESQLEKVKPLIAERRLCGELDHPQNDTVKLANASHLVTKLEMKGNDLIGEAEILKTPAGLTAKALVEGGVKIGISSRGMGTLSEDHNGDKIVNEDFRLVTFDLVADPSTRGAYPALAESTESKFVRESQSKLKKESNFVTMLESKMRDAYQPWIEEAKKPKKPKKPEPLKDKIAKLNKDREKYPLIRSQAQAVSDAFELVKADGHWHRIAEALLGETFDELSKKDERNKQTKQMLIDLNRMRKEGGDRQMGARFRSIPRAKTVDKYRKAAAGTAPVAKKAPEKKAPEKRAPEKKAPEKKAPEKKAPEKRAPRLMRVDTDNPEERQVAAATSYKQIGSILMEGIEDINKEADEERAAKALGAAVRPPKRTRSVLRRPGGRATVLPKPSGVVSQKPDMPVIGGMLRRHGERAQLKSDARGAELAKGVGDRERATQTRRTAQHGAQQQSRTEYEAQKQADSKNMGLGGEVRHGISYLASRLKGRGPGLTSVRKAQDLRAKAKPVSSGDGGGGNEAPIVGRPQLGPGPKSKPKPEVFPRENPPEKPTTPSIERPPIDVTPKPRQIAAPKDPKPRQIADPKEKPERFPPVQRSDKNIAKRAKDLEAIKALRAKGSMEGARSSMEQRKKSRQRHWSSPEFSNLPRKAKKAANIRTRIRAGTEYAQIGSMLAEMLGLNEKALYTQGPQERAETIRRFNLKQSRLPKHKQLQAGKSQAQKDTENKETDTRIVQSGKRL